MNGTFYTVEGLDGSGTTSVVEAIADEPDVVTSAEPTDNEIGRLLRAQLGGDNEPQLSDLFLFLADRDQHLRETVRPALEDGQCVVLDRYADSTRAYQPVVLAEHGPFDEEIAAKQYVEQTIGPVTPDPDLTFYLDVSVETALERSDGDEKYEQRAFLNAVRENYEALHAANERIVRIDAERPLDEVVAEVRGLMNTASADRL